MVTQEPLLEKALYYSIDGYESDEALSLCDLPLHSDLIQTLQESQQDQLEQDHHFEFFRSASPVFPPENIIFCGKIITPDKKSSRKEAPKKPPAEIKKIKKRRGWDLIRWMLSSGQKGTTINIHKDHLLLFGTSSRLSSHHKVELRDIKKRQSSRHLSQSEGSGFGLSRLIGLLSCGGNHHPNAMVVKSTRGISDFPEI
ncbi:pentatricopeptide repeat (PPR) superfamily protein [Striga asiatica]|uniref:Pentatricopeptide repeat (PPR) superfamily protein n=1 Tax=Striga asiatica TaxID=4170 RepID=A0A5A7R1P0_STRAF|nr:pentatricopeptide repeat (PPR) superfamily protein [Striga asiatica]